MEPSIWLLILSTLSGVLLWVRPDSDPLPILERVSVEVHRVLDLLTELTKFTQ
jgi:hypothetical protein